MFEDLDYRQGRLDQAHWIVDRVKEYVDTHAEVMTASPGVARFLLDLSTQNALEAAHGTRHAHSV